MFRAWQVAVASVAAAYLVLALNSGLPYFIALPIALLLMAILAADAGTGFAT